MIHLSTGCDGTSDVGARPSDVYPGRYRSLRYSNHLHEKHRNPKQEGQETKTSRHNLPTQTRGRWMSVVITFVIIPTHCTQLGHVLV